MNKFTRLTFQDYYFLLTGKGEPVTNVIGENGRHDQLIICVPISIFGALLLGIIVSLLQIKPLGWFPDQNPAAIIGFGWLYFGVSGSMFLMMFFDWYDGRRHKKLIADLSGNYDAIRKEAIGYMTVENIENLEFVLQGRGNHQKKLPTFSYALLLYKELFPSGGGNKDIETALLKRAAEVFDNKWFASERKLVEEMFPANIVPLKEVTLKI